MHAEQLKRVLNSIYIFFTRFWIDEAIAIECCVRSKVNMDSISSQFYCKYIYFLNGIFRQTDFIPSICFQVISM